MQLQLPVSNSNAGTEAPATTPEPSTPVTEEVPAPPTALALSSSSSPDEVVAGPAQLLPLDNFRVHHELLKWVISNLELEVELKEPTDSLLDILGCSSPL